MTMPAATPGETIVPLFFGPESSLYGCYHLPPDYRRQPGVLICQPTGHEYERCHRAMRQLAVQAARKGLSAMRFDYFATGDSAGDCAELSLARMRQDVQQALRHCLAKTGSGRLTLVGIRLGATLAAQLAGGSNQVESLVLYAPVFDGNALLDEWQRDQQTFHDKHNYPRQQIEDDEILGFVVPETFKAELRAQFGPAPAGGTLKRVLILTDAAEIGSAPANRWTEAFERQSVEVTIEAVENIAIWRREPMEAIVPAKAIRRIIQWIMEAEHA